MQKNYCYTPGVGFRVGIHICKMLVQILSLGNLVLLYFFLYFNFAYHTNKAPYNKSLRKEYSVTVAPLVVPLNGLPGASSNWIVCLSIRNSFPLTHEVEYLMFGWSYNIQTLTVSSSKGCSHFTDITSLWGWGEVKFWDFRDFARFSLRCRQSIRVSHV